MELLEVVKMNCDDEYEGSRKIWGDVPSELGVVMVDYLHKSRSGKRHLKMLDIGCGYGRDEVYLSKHLNCDIKAIDSSREAISTAQNTVYKLDIKNVDFAACNFADLAEDKYDVVFISNLYGSLTSMLT